MTPKVEALLAAWPEERRFVDARGLLHSGEGELVLDGDGVSEDGVSGDGVSGDEPARQGFAVIGHPYGCACLVGVCGPRAVAAAKRACAGEGEDERILIAPEDFEPVRGAFDGWRIDDVWLHRLVEPHSVSAAGVAAAGVEIRLIDAPEPGLWQGMEANMALEFERAVAADKGLVAAVVDGQAVSVAYAPLETERFWDVSVDTLAAWRRRGLSAVCYDDLRQRQAKRGLEPVWGADAANTASRRMAARLGFVEDSRLLSLWPPGSDERVS